MNADRAPQLKRRVGLLVIMRGSAKHILKLREAAGKSREEMSAILGISLPAYWDLESHDDEVRDSISLSQVVRMGRAFKVSPREVVAAQESEPRQLSFIELSERIKSSIDSQTLTVAEFEEKVGWAIESALSNPDEFWAINLQCLIDICAELKIEWLSVVPK